MGVGGSSVGGRGKGKGKGVRIGRGYEQRVGREFAGKGVGAGRGGVKGWSGRFQGVQNRLRRGA